jgi:hypothetical protein
VAFAVLLNRGGRESAIVLLVRAPSKHEYDSPPSDIGVVPQNIPFGCGHLLPGQAQVSAQIGGSRADDAHGRQRRVLGGTYALAPRLLRACIQPMMSSTRKMGR